MLTNAIDNTPAVMTAMPGATSSPRTRTDIQALRGIAVLLVLFYHAQLPPFSGGYLGVDIFFVISGFLITGLIARAIGTGQFSFSEFYWRRAMRLLPAAYVVLLLCVAVSGWLLTEGELNRFVDQVLGALTFTANLVLWQQTGYFEVDATLRPLLHAWSLSIEEQYYLLLPAALVLAPRRYWLASALLLTAVSLAICLRRLPVNPTAAFYLLPTRAWELGIGSILALLPVQLTPGGWRKGISSAVLVTLFALTIWPLSKAHPGADALLVCLCTAILLAWPNPQLTRGLFGNALARVGDFSYSLYLVHWPIFAFLNSANLSSHGLPWPLRVAAASVSVVLAYVLYVQIEQRFRVRSKTNISAGKVRLLLASSLAVAVAALAMASLFSSDSDLVRRMRGNNGFGAACGNPYQYVAHRQCQNSDTPTMMVWGDSLAMQHIPGLAATPGLQLIQATKPACAPVVGLAGFDDIKIPIKDAHSCIAFNHDVLNAAIANKTVDVVVLSSRWRRILNVNTLVQAEDSIDVAPANEARAVQYFASTILALRRAGKRVVIVGPTPDGRFDVGRCYQRSAVGKVSFGAPSDCRIKRHQSEAELAQIQQFLSRVAIEADVAVFSLWDVLCDAHNCETRWGENILYRDAFHLSYEGSIVIAQRVDLARRLNELAR